MPPRCRLPRHRRGTRGRVRYRPSRAARVRACPATMSSPFRTGAGRKPRRCRGWHPTRSPHAGRLAQCLPLAPSLVESRGTAVDAPQNLQQTLLVFLGHIGEEITGLLGGDLAHLAGEVCPLFGDVEFLCASVVRRGLTRDEFVTDHLVDQPAHGGAIAHDELRDDRGAYSRMAVDEEQGGDLARSPGNIETFQALIEIARKRYVDAADIEAQRVFED